MQNGECEPEAVYVILQAVNITHCAPFFKPLLFQSGEEKLNYNRESEPAGVTRRRTFGTPSGELYRLETILQAPTFPIGRRKMDAEWGM